MKYLIIWLLFFVAACSGSNNNTVLDGVYTASFEHEFAKTDDTLILKKANDGNGVYQIIRHSGVIKKLDGKIFPKEILTDTWTLDYNTDKQILTELKGGKTFIWDSNRLTLQFGETTYKKISGL
ncbi:MAG: hypothetical protein H7178_10440 [Chitinophagaceae bacterium]|nr:hypothetical protein [Chitinophagaceae bacterium]